MRPDLPDYGVYLQWPEPGEDWIHESDRELVQRWVPSNRVFKRESFDGTYYSLRYGQQRIRVRPSLWTKVPAEEIEVGDLIEVLSHFGENEAGIGRVVEKRYDDLEERIVYLVQRREQRVPQPYHLEDFRLLTVRSQLREPDTIHPAPRLALEDHTDFLPYEE